MEERIEKEGKRDSKLNPNVLGLEREVKGKEIEVGVGKEGGIEIDKIGMNLDIGWN
jgi:hypothetical protein